VILQNAPCNNKDIVYKTNVVLLTDVPYLFVCYNTSGWKTSNKGIFTSYILYVFVFCVLCSYTYVINSSDLTALATTIKEKVAYSGTVGYATTNEGYN